MANRVVRRSGFAPGGALLALNLILGAMIFALPAWAETNSVVKSPAPDSTSSDTESDTASETGSNSLIDARGRRELPVLGKPLATLASVDSTPPAVHPTDSHARRS